MPIAPKKTVQSKAMSRIKFGSDDENSTEKENTEPAEEPPKEPETVVFNVANGDAEGGIGRRSSRRSK